LNILYKISSTSCAIALGLGLTAQTYSEPLPNSMLEPAPIASIPPKIKHKSKGYNKSKSYKSIKSTSNSEIINYRLKEENRLLRRVLHLSYFMRLTGYTAGDSSQGTGNLTALGIPAAYGTVAVDPNIIPLGSYLWIPGYGIARAADTGSGVKGFHIDLCFGRGWNAYKEAINFGTKLATVYLVPKEALPLFH
jgi:3D (Asp-Asp-Asp) domain-containing protein